MILCEDAFTEFPMERSLMPKSFGEGGTKIMLVN